MRNRDVTANETALSEARKKRLQHKIMVNTIHDIVSYILYLILLTTAANSIKSLQAYPFHRSLIEIFITKGEPSFENVSFVSIDSNIICKQHQKWLKSSVIMSGSGAQLFSLYVFAQYKNYYLGLAFTM